MQQAVSTTTFGGLQCVTGRFNLLVFIQGQIVPPVGGDVIGQIQPLTGGSPIPVIQTGSINIPLSAVDNQIVTLCGVFVFRRGQLVLDVRLVQTPFVPGGAQPPINIQNLFLLLLLLSLFGRSPFGFPFGKGGFGKGGLGKGGFGKGTFGLGTGLGTGGLNLGSLGGLNLGSLGSLLGTLGTGTTTGQL